MSAQKARTTLHQGWTWMQKHQSDIMLVLLCLHTLLLLVGFLVYASPSDVRQILRDEQARELGGYENYDRYQEILQSDAYRQQQTFLINQKYKTFFPDSYDYISSDTLSGNQTTR